MRKIISHDVIKKKGSAVMYRLKKITCVIIAVLSLLACIHFQKNILAEWFFIIPFVISMLLLMWYSIRRRALNLIDFLRGFFR